MPVYSVLFCSRPFGAMTKVPASKMLKKKSSTKLNLMFSYSSENSIPNMNMLLQSVCMHPNTYGYLHRVCALLWEHLQCVYKPAHLWVYCVLIPAFLQSMLTLSALMSTYKEHVHSDILVSICTKYVYTHELTWLCSEHVFTLTDKGVHS